MAEKADLFAPPEHSDVLAPLTRGLGPSYAVNAKPGVGLTSAHPWGYCVAGPVGRRWRAQLADTGLEGATIPVGTALRFAVFPCFDDSEPDVRDGYAATAVAVDIVFTDGSRLSDAAAVDQYGVALDPQTQYGARLLSVDQWSSRTVTLDLVVGRTVERVELVGEVPVRTDDGCWFGVPMFYGVTANLELIREAELFRILRGGDELAVVEPLYVGHGVRRLGAGRCLGLAALGCGGTAAEALDAAAGVDQLLPARVERMAVGADFHADVALVRGPRLECISARAHDIQLVVRRMDTSFHGQPQLIGRVDIRSLVGHHTIVEHSFKGCE